MNIRTLATLSAMSLIAASALAQPVSKREQARAGGREDAGQGAQIDESNQWVPKWPAYNDFENLNSRVDIQGSKLDMTELADRVSWITERPDLEGKVLIIEMWATWCPQCKSSKPRLDSIMRSTEGMVEVIRLSGDLADTEDVVRDFVSTEKSGLSHAWDANAHLANDLGVEGIPHALVLSTDGIVRWQGYTLDQGFLSAVSQVFNNDPVLFRKRESERTVMTDEDRARIHKLALERVRQIRAPKGETEPVESEPDSEPEAESDSEPESDG